MPKYSDLIKELTDLKEDKPSIFKHINPESASRMRLQNRFPTGLDIARYTAEIMRRDMADYDKDSSNYTQSLGCWHGFTAQQMMMEIKRSKKTTSKSYVYLSGWMIAALRSQFGPLPDQSMHEKTSVPKLIKEIQRDLNRNLPEPMRILTPKNSSESLGEAIGRGERILLLGSLLTVILCGIATSFSAIVMFFFLAVVLASVCTFSWHTPISSSSSICFFGIFVFRLW